MNGAATSRSGFAEPSRAWRLAIGFVIGTLIALVLVPWFVQRRVDELRGQIAVAEPARTLVTRWQFTLARQLAAIDEQLLTGDTSEFETYRYAVRREQQIRRQLAPLIQALGHRAVVQFTIAATLADEWHSRVREEEIFRYGARGLQTSEIPRELDLFENALTAVAQIDSAIASIVLSTTVEIRRAERTGLTLTLALGVLALLAAGTVIALQHRIRDFAAEAERRRAQAASALTEMAESEEARQRLLRGVTHDVKNPLGAAKGFIELLNLGVKAPVAPEQKPLLEGAARSIDSALRIIDDMLEVARSEYGAIRVNRKRVDLNDVAAETVHEYHAAARAAGHSIEHVPAEGPLNLTTDPARVRQILENLLSNAVKYTPPPGRITVRVRRTKEEEEGAPAPGPWATILVSDTGPGIPRDKREAVFEEYTRLQQPGTSGHGLGLAIARGIARRLGGDLTIADSEPGATFVLWLPIEDSSA